MNYFLLILIFIAGIGVGIFVARKKGAGNAGAVEAGQGPAQGGQENIAAVNAKREKAKEEAKQKVLQLFESKTEIKNDDVETLLDISDATATRYLDELEKEGQIVQEGTTGQAVVYKKR